MAKFVFVCDVTQRQDGPPVFIPAMEEIRNGPDGTFPCSWTISIAVSPPLAVGVCDINPAQLAAIDADTRIFAVPIEDMNTHLNQYPPDQQAKIEAMANKYGYSPKPSDSMRELYEFLIAKFDTKKITDIEAELLRNFGV